ncbi:MAG: hypothetical protein AVDCRST_MAG10-1019, partial [uncultured Acidimicrobiales bacterium]
WTTRPPLSATPCTPPSASRCWGSSRPSSGAGSCSESWPGWPPRSTRRSTRCWMTWWRGCRRISARSPPAPAPRPRTPAGHSSGTPS